MHLLLYDLITTRNWIFFEFFANYNSIVFDCCITRSDVWGYISWYRSWIGNSSSYNSYFCFIFWSLYKYRFITLWFLMDFWCIFYQMVILSLCYQWISRQGISINYQWTNHNILWRWYFSWIWIWKYNYWIMFMENCLYNDSLHNFNLNHIILIDEKIHKNDR